MRGAINGERKTITALFADLKGSTAIIEHLDPEEARAILDPALQLMMDSAHRYDGYVAQAMGDGILALFGAPVAQEDHAQRAIFAALHMQEEMARYNDTVRLRHGVPLAMRVGINTGEVVLRSIRKDDLHTDYVPVGHSINLAARMEQMATPGSILVTESTQKLVDGYVQLKTLGAATIKGVETPLPVYEVLGVGQYRTRLQLAVRRGLTRFIGRRQELEQMQRALDEAVAGHGQVVGVMGEPGMGKSRLFHEFKQQALERCAVLEAYSSSHGKASPYLPLTELLKSYFQIQVQDDERARREKVIGRVLGLDRTLEDTLPFYFSLLNVEDLSGTVLRLEPQLRRRRMFEALKRVLLRESLNRPLLVIFEDLHWIDAETQGFLDSLMEALGSARVLLLTNYRPEYRHEWGGKTYYTQLRLTPFGRAEAEDFLGALLGEVTMPEQGQRWAELRQTILDRTEGTPFFIEEVVQELFEQGTLLRDAAGRVSFGTLSVDGLQLPATVQGVLAARIDRLGPEEKSLLQELAVIGREFPWGLAQAVVGKDDGALQGLLAILLRKEFLYEQPAFPEVEYIFKHALTQEVAYQSLLVENRKLIHARAATAIERTYALELEDHYGDLAHHYGRSDDIAKAIDYAELAAGQAIRQAANVDAVQLILQALDLLRGCAAGRERDRRELRLQLSLAPPLQMVKGMASDEMMAVFDQARALAAAVGTADDRLRLNVGFRTYLSMRAEVDSALALAEEMLVTASGESDPHFALQAHAALSVALVTSGRYAEAAIHAERVSDLYDFERDRGATRLYGFDPCALAVGFQGLIANLQGHFGRGRALTDEVVALTQRIGHPHVVGFGLAWRALTCLVVGDVVAGRHAAEYALVYSEEHAMPDWTMYAGLIRGWARGDAEGDAEMSAGIAMMSAAHAELALPLFLARQAENRLARGDVEGARMSIAVGQDFCRRTGEKFWDGETLRICGEVAIHEDGEQDTKEARAEAYFHDALAIAESRGAKMWELRVTMSLAKLWKRQGRHAEARERLKTLYAWFTEGFETSDLRNAKALIEELSSVR